MSTLRQDLLTGRWVILAAGRGKRPNDFPLTAGTVADSTGCPFCPGREDQTPKEVLTVGRPENEPANTPGWNIRVFPNKYPALGADSLPANAGCRQSPLFPEIAGKGKHEVIVYSSRHDDGPASISTNHFFELLKVIRHRFKFMATIDGTKYVLPFWNHGPEAGATLAHPHLQIVASPLVPALVIEKTERQADYYSKNSQCLLCHLRQQEIQKKERIIADGKYFTALTPWASRLPYEMMVLPNNHQSRFAETTDGQLADLAEVLGNSLRGLLAVHADPPLNIIIHEAPLAVSGDAGYGELVENSFHWHLEVIPRLSRMAGFEAGTGFTINSVSAEQAARVIRGEGS